jgi:hypothetical protein
MMLFTPSFQFALARSSPRRFADLACRASVDRQNVMARSPPLLPWDIEDNGACFIVRDSNRQALSYVYYENAGGRRAAANLLTRDEARRIAANIAKPPSAAPPINFWQCEKSIRPGVL